MAGAAIGSILGGPLADSCGRRRSILFSAGLFIVGAVIMAISPVFWLFILGRFIVGAAVGSSGMVVSVYLSELSSPYWRGMIVATNELAVCTGCLLALSLSVVAADAGFHWRALLGLSAVPAAVQLLGSPWLPTSPVWAVQQIVAAYSLEELHAIVQPTSAVAAQPTAVSTCPPNGKAVDSSTAAAFKSPRGAHFNWLSLPSVLQEQLSSARETFIRLRGSAKVADQEILAVISQHISRHTTRQLNGSGQSAESIGSDSAASVHASSTRSLLSSQSHDGTPGSGCSSPLQERQHTSNTGERLQLATCSSPLQERQHTSNFSIETSEGARSMKTRQATCPRTCAALDRATKDLADAWRQPGSRHALALAISAAIVQNMAFSNALLYYARSIFTAAGLSQPLLPSIGVGVAKLLGVAVAIPLLPRMPRRRLLATGMLGQIAACLAMGLVFAYCNQHSAELGPVVLAGMLVFIFAWDVSWAPGLWVVCSEVLPNNIRGTGMGLAVGAFWASSAISNQLVLTISDGVGWSGFMAIVGGLTLFALGFVLVALPETQGRTIEVIQADISTRSKSVPRTFLLCPLFFWPIGICSGSARTVA
jgi:MFS family permease